MYRDSYSSIEINILRKLISLRVEASQQRDKSAQTKLRNQMRGMGFYGQEYFGIHDLQLSDFENLIKEERIKISDDNYVTESKENLRLAISKKRTNKKGREDSDEFYIIDLCDEVLGLKASRQHLFDFLRGDISKKYPRGKGLPVDAYYESLNLGIEFEELHHSKASKFFDKPDVITISGINRSQQRIKYVEKRKEILPKNNISLVFISFHQFELKGKKLKRVKEKDISTVKQILNRFLK